MVQIIALILGLFKFWDQVMTFVALMQQTPEEKHEEIMQKVESVFDEIANSGRPHWDI